MQPYSQKVSAQTNVPIIPIVQKKDLTCQENLKYYEEYKKILETSFLIRQQIKELQTKKSALILNVLQIQNKFEEANESSQDKRKQNQDSNRPKRNRRTNNMIQKNYKCPGQKCQKEYASQGSLQQHLKIKHPDLTFRVKQDQQKKQQTQNIKLLL